MEDRLKHEVNKIGQRSVEALKKLFRFVNGTLKEQNEEYEHIFSTIQQKQTGKVRRVRIKDEVDEDLAPVAKRSKSHSDILQLEDEDGMMSSGKATGIPSVIKSKSQAWLTSPKSRIALYNIGDPEQSPTLQIDEVEKDKPMGKATITKKGQIILTTTPIQQTEFGTTFKVQDPVYRKVKPTPINHSKLKKKQTELLTRKDPKGGHTMYGKSSWKQAGGRKPVGKGVLTDFELPADFYSEYTVGELEKTATKIADQQKQQHHDDMLEKVHLPFVKDMISPRQNTALKTPPEDRFLPML